MGAPGIARREPRQCGIAPVVADVPEGTRQGHISERHLARSVRVKRDANVTAIKLEIGAADQRHLVLIAGSLEKAPERADERQLAPTP